MTGAVFVDTSALYAVLDADDAHHPAARAGWDRLLDALADTTAEAVTHGSVVVETSALVQRRLGLPALRALHDEVLPLLAITWVADDLHRRAVAALLAAGRRDVSLVDWTSFQHMRDAGITTAFAFDDDFAAQGFSAWGTPPTPAAPGS